MRARGRSIGLVLGLIALLATASTSPGAGQDAAIHGAAPADQGDAALLAMAEAFAAACPARDLERLGRLWSPSTSHRAEGEESLRRDLGPQGARALVRDVQVAGDRGSVRMVLETEAPGGTPGPVRARRMHRRLEVVREAGVWTIGRYVSVEEELVEALLAARTEEDRRRRLEAEPDLDAAELARAAAARGSALLKTGKARDAHLLLDQALRLAEPVETSSVRAGILSDLAAAETQMGQMEAATEHARRAMSLAEESGSREKMAQAANELGRIHVKQGDFEAAREQFTRSLAWAEEAKDQGRISAELTNLGTVATFLGDEPGAVRYYQRSLALAEAIGDQRLLASSLNNLSNVYVRQGDYGRALVTYQRALAAAERAQDQNLGLHAVYNIGTVYFYQGDDVQALRYFEKALQAAEATGDKTVQPTILGSIGYVHQRAGRHDQALKTFDRALALSDQMGLKDARAGVLSHLGDLHRAAGDDARARESYQEELKLGEEIGDKRSIVEALVGISRAEVGDLQERLATAQRAVAMAREVNLPDDLRRGLLSVGQLLRALGRPEEARDALAEAIETIESLRDRATGRGNQRFLERKLSPYHEMVSLLVDGHDLAGALAYADRAKGRALLDVLQGGQDDIGSALSPEERQKELALRRQLRDANTQLRQEAAKAQPDRGLLGKLQAARDGARLEYEAYETSLHAAHPELRLGRGEVRPFVVADADETMVDARTALLEFVVTEDRTYLFVVTRDGPRAPPRLAVHRLEIRSSALAERVRRFRELLGRRNLGFHGEARALFRLLLGPAEQELRGRRLIALVPDDVLWELPFQALEPRPGRYLLEDHAVYYVPSLGVLRELRGKPDPAEPAGVLSLLALGNPAPGSVAGEPAALRSLPLGSLPEAEAEVRDLRTVYGASHSAVFTGRQAGEARLKREIGHYDVVHLAAHAVLDDASPLYSHLVLAPEGEEDGLLEAWEVTRLHIRARLVVLSACQTAGGRVAPGEGMVGMAWAFAVAGCPTTVVSQWPVDSAGTRALMVSFHRKLTGQYRRPSGAVPAEALRAAALELARQPAYRHPFYWASFVVVGDGGWTPRVPRATASGGR